jgi:hypothetical protein
MHRTALRRWIVVGAASLLFGAGCRHCAKDAPEDSVCPAPIHPDYCRRDCKRFSTRRRTRHAGRVPVTEEGRVGTCGKWLVFTQRDPTNDASIVEYFDPNSEELVGAVDPRRTDECTTFGAVPECTIALRDLPWPWADYRILDDAGETKLESDFERESQVWDCYTDALWEDAGAKGTLRLTLSRGDASSVVSVEPLDAGMPLGATTTACIVDAFRLRPPPLTGGQKLTIEIALHPLDVRDR